MNARGASTGRGRNPAPVVMNPPGGKWYCTIASCRMLNFYPSLVCSNCKAERVTPKGQVKPTLNGPASTSKQQDSSSQPNASTVIAVAAPANNEIGVKRAVSTSNMGVGRGRGRGRGILHGQQCEVGLSGRPKMRRSLPLIINAKTMVLVSWVESLSEFYVVRTEDMDDLNKIENATFDAGNWPNLENPVIDDSCLCFDEQSDYSGWFRARILGIGENSYQVQFVDFGNKNLEYKNKLKCLTEEWMGYPELAKKVMLKVPETSVFPPDAGQIFRKLTKGFTCCYVPLEYDGGRECYVGSLIRDGMGDIAQILITAGSATTSTSSPSPLPLPSTQTEAETKTGTSTSTANSEESSGPYSFTLDKLERPVVQVADTRSFVITTAVDFNHFYLRDTEKASRHQLFELQDLMNEYMRKEKKNKTPVNPVVGEIYLVGQQAEGGKKYFRGVIEKVTKGRYCQVRNVDFGREFFVCATDLTRMTQEIFEIPALAYEVKLAKLENSPNLIFKEDFDNLIRSLHSDKEVFNVKNVEVVDLVATADLIFRKDRQLATKIMELRKWLWEHLYEMGSKTDDEIIQKEETLGSESVVTDIKDLDLPLRADIEAVVRSVVLQDEMELLPHVIFEPVTKYTTDLKEAFTHQVNSYMEKVSPSKFFPGFSEMAFALPPEGFPGAGAWQRCLRIPQLDLLYCLDTYVRYPITRDSKFTIRRVAPDFIRIPAFVVAAQLHDPQFDRFTADCIQKTFIVGKKVTIKLLRKLDVNFFTFESCDLEETMRQELYSNQITEPKKGEAVDSDNRETWK